MIKRDIYQFADDLRTEVIKAYERNLDAYEITVVAKFAPTDWNVHIGVGKRIGITKR